MPQQCYALLSDDSSQTDTLNPTQVQSYATCGINLTRIKEKDSKNKETTVSNVLTSVFPSYVCAHVSIYTDNIIHISLVGVGSLSNPTENNMFFFLSVIAD